MAAIHCRKLRTDNPTTWTHHRGGWTYAVRLVEEHLCCDDGVLFDSSVGAAVMEEQVVSEPWVGVVHPTPKTNYPVAPDLERLVIHPVFLESLKACRGLFTLCDYATDYLNTHLPKPTVPVATLLYPATPTDIMFDYNKWLCESEKSVVFIGEFMRNFQYFFDLDLPRPYRKKMLLAPDVDLDRWEVKVNGSVEMISHVDDARYDEILSRSIVFLNMFDAAGTTTAIECITRNTPFIVNRLPALEEYLGKEYPLFYETVDEAVALVTSDTKLLEGHTYLTTLDIKQQLTGEKFIEAIQDTSIYRCLEVPPSQQTIANTPFKSYDISVVICSYKRIHNMRKLLHSLVNQTTDKTFEVIIWNNNFEARDELQTICDEFMCQLNLKVIHSTENYFCIIRLAAAGGLVRSDAMVVVDDDVIPTPVFLHEYMTKYAEYGPRAVLCCTGVRWRRHELDHAHPGWSWTEYEDVRFFHEAHADIKIHFLHATTCLLPVALLRDVIGYPLPSYNTILVDDYWLSFVLSHYMGVPLWKIRGDHMFETTPSSDDPAIAMYLNPRVREERVKMYVYHMTRGWPNDVIEDEGQLECSCECAKCEWVRSNGWESD